MGAAHVAHEITQSQRETPPLKTGLGSDPVPAPPQTSESEIEIPDSFETLSGELMDAIPELGGDADGEMSADSFLASIDKTSNENESGGVDLPGATEVADLDFVYTVIAGVEHQREVSIEK